MSSRPEQGRGRSSSRDRPDHQGSGVFEEETVEAQGAESDPGEAPQPASREDQQDQPAPGKKRTRPTSPAYVAPIPKIGPIAPVEPGIGVPPSARPWLPELVGNLLVGKRVDEFGDVVDGETGRVLARTAGDLPSLVGRAVSNARGDILGDDGELLGYVAGLGSGDGGGDAADGIPPWLGMFPGARKMSDVMRQRNLPLMVDPLGNILDPGGSVVGKFHDNNNPLHVREREKAREPGADGAPAAEETAGKRDEEVPGPETGSAPKARGPDRGPGGDGERHEEPRAEERQNAQSWRKENESPSDIFLDVKSTTEGIQLTIRIPTVFNGQQAQPRVQFS